MMNKKTVRNIFIIFLIYLPLQYSLVGIVGYYKSEPWPAFVFPGFKNIYVYEDGFEIDKPWFEIISEDSISRMKMPPGTFFPEIPTSKIVGFMRTHFADRERLDTFDRETKAWLIDHADEFTDDRITGIHLVWEKNYFSKLSENARPDSVTEFRRFALLRTQD